MTKPTYPRTYTEDGVTMTISQWAKALGKNISAINKRIYKGKPLLAPWKVWTEVAVERPQ